MYEVRFTVSDGKLPSALRALHGLTFGLPQVLVSADEEMSAAELSRAKPVAPIKATPKWKKGRKRPVHPGGQHLKGQGSTAVIRDLIQKTGITTISAREMKKATMKADYSAGAYSHAIKILRAEGLLKPLDTMGDYEVVRSAAAA